tara:strand:+ start:594 stop:1445 length:852 start_codon:yes stop_codon:yes gene_type:complete
MSTIAVTPVYDGAIIPTETINDNFNKFTEINGSLGALNVAGIDKELDHRHLQLGALSGGEMVGGTANLDYFNGIRYLFVKNANPASAGGRTMGDYDSHYLSYYGTNTTRIDSTFAGVTDATASAAARTLAVPGASTSFFVPYRAHVIVTWQVSWTSDAARFGPTPVRPQGAPDKSEFDKPNTAMRFFFDGAEHNQASTTRETREAMFASPRNIKAFTGANELPSDIQKHALRDRYKSRYWSGHAYVGVKSKGFHSASLRVCANQLVRQTRVRVRNIKVLYFKA